MKVNVIGLRGFPGIQGGVERHCEALYPRMTCRFRVFRRRPYLNPKSDRQYPAIEFSDLPSTRIAGFEALAHSFLATVHSLIKRPDLVHIHNIGPGLMIPLLKLFGLKVVMTYHSPNYEHSKWGPMARALLRLGEKCSISLADRIIFVNKAQMEKFSADVRAKSVWIANGVSREARTDATDYLQSLGMEDEPYVLAVGRLTPEKGFEYLVRAVNRVPEIKHLVIAGGSDHSERYLHQLQQLDTGGKVVFTGNLAGEPLRQLYSHASLFVLSSVNEGFPLVLLEAMNYGLPVIASRIPGTRMDGLLTEDDKFQAADDDALVAKLIERYQPQPELKVYDLSTYDWSAIAERTLQVYKDALS